MYYTYCADTIEVNRHEIVFVTSSEGFSSIPVYSANVRLEKVGKYWATMGESRKKHRCDIITVTS